MRLNKFIAHLGLMSRREADRAILDGRVKIGDRVAVTEEVSEGDIVYLDGKRIGSMEDVSKAKKIIIALNKPRGVVCTTSDKDKATTVIDIVGMRERIYPIGRLDKDSEGLILLTNQGELSDVLMRSSNNHEKEYIVKVNREIDAVFLERMSKGVYLRELNVKTKKCRVEKLNKNTFRIILTQGLNRQIRRMCEELSFKVIELRRVRIENIWLRGINIGEYRSLTDAEIKELYKRVGLKWTK